MMCKFYNECEYASSTAFTCREGGGNYCGKYRLLATRQRTIKDIPMDCALPAGSRDTLL